MLTGILVTIIIVSISSIATSIDIGYDRRAVPPILASFEMCTGLEN